jgi:outer membrane protein
MLFRTALASGSALAAALVFGLVGGAAQAQPRTLQQALAAAYSNNPTLQASRAQLRATDENVPNALSGWRPQVTFTGTAGIAAGKNDTVLKPSAANGNTKLVGSSADRGVTSAGLTVTQPLYRGGKTRASTNRAENQVMATRAQLLATEQQVFSDTVSAYVNVIQDEQILQLDISNEQVLTKQLQSTNDRFRVGELTRTDVAQAEAALASASATRQTAEGTLQSARATYEQLVGERPGKLLEPQPLQTPVKTLEEAKMMASQNNPNVVAALFNDAAARDAFDVAYSALMPNLSLQGQVFRNENQIQTGLIQTGGQLLASLSVPIYQGGSEYAAIRQARQQELQSRRQLDEQRRAAVQLATSSWEQLVSARAAIASDRAAIRANQIALEGVEREALVGSRTTLDVLTAEQTLLNSQTALVQALAQLVNASYQVASASGRLTARNLNLQVPLYDEKAYYNAVKNLWVGTGDYAVDQPGR